MDIEFLMALPFEMKIEAEASEGGFYASYPQLLGCNAFGNTREEAIGKVQLSKRKWLEMALRTGLDIPVPSSEVDSTMTKIAITQSESSHVALYGPILGDMIGAPYEFDRGEKTKDFVLFDRRKWIHYTDDTVMTLAIAKAVMEVGADADEGIMKVKMIACMQDYGNRFAIGEYGDRFYSWLQESNPHPYGSYGNGAAMRASPIGWCYDSLERTREVARWSAEISHDHPEGIKGAESVASAIFLLRNGCSKEELKEYINREFGYDLSRTLDVIRPNYHHVESCQETVPEAITAFLESEGFEDAIRNAVSLGGDCDTLTCITGSLAEACYGVPNDMIRECENRIPEELLQTLKEFQSAIL